MFNFDYITKEDIKKHDPKIPDYSYRTLIEFLDLEKQMHCLI